MTPELVGLFLASTLRLATPLAFAAMGEYVSEKSGVLNMSIEGMMLAGAFAGAVGSWATGSPMLGLLLGVLIALPVAAVQSLLTNVLRANQIVTGIGLNILILGATTLGYRELFGERSREEIPGWGLQPIPGLSDLPVIGSAFTQVWLVWMVPVIGVLIWAVMRYTGLGLKIIAAGDAPDAVANSGSSVRLVRTGAIFVTAILSAMGGVYLSIGDIHTFTEGMTNGAGYLAIAAVIFGNWRLWRTVGACLLFGAANALQFQLPAMGINVPGALLIMLPYLLALIAVAGLAGRQLAPAYLTKPW